VTTDPRLLATVTDAFDRRTEPVQRLAADAGAIAQACHDMAVRFAAGGRLLVFGNGAGATDAEHIAVEFVHPVIVGKRALPALSLASDVATLTGIALRRGIDEVFSHQITSLGRPGDIALGLSDDGNCENVLRGLRAARAAGMLAIGLVGGSGGSIAGSAVTDHCLVTHSSDTHVVKEAHVTTYHVLWELVHVFFAWPRTWIGWPGRSAAPATSPSVSRPAAARPTCSTPSTRRSAPGCSPSASPGMAEACQCGEVLKGVLRPWECKVFGTACTPETPIGTCMVSSEGACAAYYNYGRYAKQRIHLEV
jgi:D-sedoheptulose 7-phosphate isomerase